MTTLKNNTRVVFFYVKCIIICILPLIPTIVDFIILQITSAVKVFTLNIRISFIITRLTSVTF